MFYVYVLVSDKKEKYVGYTSDLRKRLLSHNSDRNISTKNQKWKLAYYEAFHSESDARKREIKLKHHGRSKQILFERIDSSLSDLGAGEALK